MKKLARALADTKLGLASIALLAVMLLLVPVRAPSSQTPITIIERNTDIDFGTVVLSSSQSVDIVMSYSGFIRVAGVPLGWGARGRSGIFLIRGDSHEAVDVTLTITSATMINSVNASDTLTLSALTTNLGPNPRIGRFGRLPIGVGATLTVPANALGGTYSGGSYQVTVNYN